MYINHVVYKKSPFKGLNTLAVNHQNQAYFLDLYARYGDKAAIDLNKPAYRYEHMGVQLFNLVSEKTNLHKTDLLIFSDNQFSRATEYGSPELFLKNYSKISCELFEFKESGVLYVFGSLHFMLALSRFNVYQNILCCSLSGEWARKNNHHFMAAILINQKQKSDCALKILDCRIILKSTLLSFLHEYFRHDDLHLSKTLFCIRPELKNEITKLDDCLNFNFIECVNNAYLYHVLCNLTQKNTGFFYQHIFIIDYDKAIHSYGVLLLEKCAIKKGMLI